MGERDDARAGDETREGQEEHLAAELSEGATPGTTGALDGAAAVGSLGAVGGPAPDSELPGSPPDPTIGPD
jgi:hypothetical protein